MINAVGAGVALTIETPETDGFVGTYYHELGLTDSTRLQVTVTVRS